MVSNEEKVRAWKKQRKEFILDLARKYNNKRIAERAASSRPYVVVFLVHHLHAWPAVEGLWRGMYEDDDFSPVVISIPHKFNRSDFHGEDKVHQFLSSQSIPHLRFPFANMNGDLKLLMLEPDAIVRQSPWGDQFPAEYLPTKLNFIRDIHTEYGFSPIEEPGYRRNPQSNFSWVFLCANEDQKECWLEENPRLKRIFVTGYPKFEVLENKLAKSEGEWPISNTRGRNKPFRILWTAHHSIDPSESYGFGAFPSIYEKMLRLARQNSDIEIVFRPHPQLLEQRPPSCFPRAREVLISFLKAWQTLPNTATSAYGGYVPLFKASDCLFSDGISFLAEYQITEKPIIYFDSQHHRRFNKVGERCISSTYRVFTMEEALDRIFYLKKMASDNQHDELFYKRKGTHNYLMPYRGHTIEHALQIIKREMQHTPIEDFYRHLEYVLDTYY